MRILTVQQFSEWERGFIANPSGVKEPDYLPTAVGKYQIQNPKSSAEGGSAYGGQPKPYAISGELRLRQVVFIHIYP